MMYAAKLFVELIILGLLAGLTIRAAIQVNAGYRKLGGRVRSAQDMVVVRDIIDRNMRAAVWAVVWICAYILVVLALGNVSLLLLLAPVMLPLGLVGRVLEKRFREMPVVANDPRIEPLFRRWVTQWRGAYNRLPNATQELEELLTTPAPVHEGTWPPAPDRTEW